MFEFLNILFDTYTYKLIFIRVNSPKKSNLFYNININIKIQHLSQNFKEILNLLFKILKY